MPALALRYRPERTYPFKAPKKPVNLAFCTLTSWRLFYQLEALITGYETSE